MTKEYDLIKDLENEIAHQQRYIASAEGRISMLNSIIEFLRNNNIKCSQEVDEATVDSKKAPDTQVNMFDGDLK